MRQVFGKFYRLFFYGPEPAPIRRRAAWSAVFGVFFATVLITLILPAPFGLQSFTQWGGMYDDHWCVADQYSANPFTTPAEHLRHESLSVGDGKYRVYSVPSHNMQSCLMWVRDLCGKPATEGWTIRWVRPRFKTVHYLGDLNACDVQVDSSVPWFRSYAN